jgi:uncharacterized lipoprotein YajG
MPGAKLWPLSMLIIVAGCATQPKVAKQEPDVICHSEPVTGRLISKSVCTTKAERDAQQLQIDELRRVSSESAPTAGRTTPPQIQ